MKITTEMTIAALEMAKKVYEKQMTLQNAVDYLEDEYRMNQASAKDYINNFKLMLNGERFTRTNNLEATEYSLQKISEDYGNDRLRNALTSLKEHIKYYEQLRNVKLKGLRSILEKYISELNSKPESLYPDEIEVSKNLFEGAKKTITVNSYERNTKARSECIKYYGIQCSVCEINFQRVYGDIGKDFIHVHHLTQLSDIGESYKIDPINDLRPVCPNCHSMLHRKKPPYTIEELKQIHKLFDLRFTAF